jgi:predicted alpha-1,2-mannosidase
LRSILALALVSLSSVVSAQPKTPVESVNPFIGTGGHGHTFPGATLPFGMVQLGPDTRLEGWDGCSGYHFSDTVVYGFSHTHLSGTGISDYGDVLFMPLSGEPLLANGHPDDPDAGYASRFDKRSEHAAPGYYTVRLADEGIDVELTATERTGLHRYRYTAGRPARLILDLAHRDRVLDSRIRVVNDHEIEGMRRSTGWARDQQVYFVARFSRPIEKAELALDGVVVPGADALRGADVRARFDFGAGGELLLRVGISAVDIEGARSNLNEEQAERAFADVRAAATASWEAALGRIDVEGAGAAEREVFYTALYHAMIAPNAWSDVDGRYRGMDGEVHDAGERRQYTVFSLWDTFRAAHPLLTLIEPERTREFVETFLAQYRQGGRLPVWELAANETDTMIGYHAIPVIADAWIKGIRGFDGDAALGAMIDSATRENFGLAAYKRQGFIGIEDESESVSKTLEYAFDDGCIARLAEELQREDVAAEYDRRSGAWRHLFDPQTGFMRARRNQRWLEPFDPRQVNNHYTEANAWQYRFFVPHDNDGLIEALGGDEAFVEQLDAMFAADSATTGREQADITGLIGQYAHGNEPSHHVAWLYHYAGRPEKSAERVHQILRELYTPAPDGLSGNEDCGQMSAWYVFSAMGFYPATPCSKQYPLGPPLFERVTLNLEDGRTFTIRRKGTPPANGGFHVAKATLDGAPLKRSYLTHDEILAGGELVLTLTAEPLSAWGVAPAERPRTGVAGPAVPAAPYVVSASDRFRETLIVELRSADPNARIRYTTDPNDGRAPQLWDEYEAAFEIADSTRLRLFSDHDGARSPIVESYLHRIPNDWTVRLSHEPLAQYTAGGPEALVDGLPGDSDWRTGGWLGFQGVDFVVEIDLGASRRVGRLGARFLQDQRSWIWMPTEVVFLVSEDGTTYREVGRGSTDVAEDAPGVLVRSVSTDADASNIRFVKVHARNYGTIPDWHLGGGGEGFIFVDEITIE